MTMRFFVVDEDVPIFTFSPPQKVTMKIEREGAFAFSEPTKVRFEKTNKEEMSFKTFGANDSAKQL